MQNHNYCKTIDRFLQIVYFNDKNDFNFEQFTQKSSVEEAQLHFSHQ